MLRNKYSGFEVNSRYVSTLYKSGAIDMLGGKSWGSGNFWIGGLYERRGTFLRNERDYLRQDLRPFGWQRRSPGRHQFDAWPPAEHRGQQPDLRRAGDQRRQADGRAGARPGEQSKPGRHVGPAVVPAQA